MSTIDASVRTQIGWALEQDFLDKAAPPRFAVDRQAQRVKPKQDPRYEEAYQRYFLEARIFERGDAVGAPLTATQLARASRNAHDKACTEIAMLLQQEQAAKHR